MLRAGRSSSLPFMRTPLVGRQQEGKVARDLLLEASVPLLTLTGPGGVGKTRLALAVAHDVADAFADGAVFVDLAPLRHSGLILSTISAALDIRSAGGRPLVEVLVDYLRSRQILIVLDNFEHVIDAAPRVAGLLTACPALQFLVTSRAPLHIGGEYELAVPPLPLPDDVEMPVDELMQVEAVALFMARAHATNLRFAPTAQDLVAIAACCRRLDGLPLAIELAASRMRVLSPAALLAQLDRLGVLASAARDRPDRQRTLHDAITWSYALLSPSDQSLFSRLSCFAGGFDLEAAVAITGDDPQVVLDGVTTLVDQNLLLRIEPSAGISEIRFRMLETIRAYARERLERGSDEELREAHARYFLSLAERAEYSGPAMRPWLDRLAVELANLRVALDYFAASGASTSELRLAVALLEFWWQRTNLREGMERLQGALARAPEAPLNLRAKAAGALSTQHGVMGSLTEALLTGAQAVAWARASGDPDAVSHANWCYAMALGRRGNQADREEAFLLLQEAAGVLASRPCSTWVASFVLAELGEVSGLLGDPAQGLAYFSEALERALSCGEAFAIGSHHIQLGVLLQREGKTADAARHYGEGMRTLWEIRDTMTTGWALVELAALAGLYGRAEESARMMGAVAAIRERTGNLLIAQFPEGEERAKIDLGTERYAQVRDIGRAAPLADIVAEALALAERLANIPALPAAPVESRSQAQPADPPAVPFGLSPREREVLVLLAQRRTDNEIAADLFISYRTVTTHVVAIFNKLGVSNRRDAAAIAARHGLV